MNSVDLVIDLGTKYTTISKRGVVGAVVKDDTAVRVRTTKNKKMLLLESGSEAVRGDCFAADEQVFRPIFAGAVTNNERAFALMCRDFISRTLPRSLFKPKVKAIVCVSLNLTLSEKKTIESVLLRSGVDEVVMLETPLAINALLGGGNNYIIDMGAAKTDFAVVDRNGIVAGCSVNIGGITLNKAIVNYIEDNFRRIVNDAEAERYKIKIGTLYDNDATGIMVDPRSVGNAPHSKFRLSARDVKTAIEPVILKILEIAYNYSFQIRDYMADDICQNGITLAGGTSYISGIDSYFSEALSMPVHRLDDPVNAAVKGGQYYFEHPSELNALLQVKI